MPLVLVLVAPALAGAGSGTGSAGWKRVHFRAPDGVLLDGRLFGRGQVGIVLSHMGRPGDTQADWLGLAEVLSGRGYAAERHVRPAALVELAGINHASG